GNETELHSGPDPGKVLDRGQTMDAGDDRIDHLQHQRQPDVDRDDELPENDDGVPAGAVVGVAEQSNGVARLQANDPSQRLYDDLQRRGREVDERFGGLADLDRGDTQDDRDDDQLEHVEGQPRGQAAVRGIGGLGLQSKEVARDQPLQEVQPGDLPSGVDGGRRVNGAVFTGAGDQPQRDAEGDRDQRGDGEPQQGLSGQARRVGDVAQVGDG